MQLLLSLVAACSCIAAASISPLRFKGVQLQRVSLSAPPQMPPTPDEVDLGTLLQESADDGQLTLVLFSTYAADFNAIEYCQKLGFYLPRIKEKGVKSVKMILNAEPVAARLLCKLVDLPCDDALEVYSDPMGRAGREFGVNRGWKSDDGESSPYLKLFGMLFGLGAAWTLPSVLSGYVGNPFGKREWIESALVSNTIAGRFPANAVEVEGGKMTQNKFDALPMGIGGWGRRPLELATLRLQNMLGISLQNWQQLRPSEEALQAGVLTQLGGCALFSGKDLLYEFKDDGICHTADFEQLLKVI